MNLWQTFIESPEARAGAVAALVSILMWLLKQYLPTGHDPDDPTKATENRWVPLIHFALTLLICAGGALYTEQDLVESVFWGVVGSPMAIGAVRGLKLAFQGDNTERQRAAAVVKAQTMEKKADQLEGALSAVSTPVNVINVVPEPPGT